MTASTIVTFVGHSTILIEMDGVRLITDPVLRSFLGPLHRQVPLPNITKLNVDAILISHLHGDHFNLASLKLIGPETRLIVPRRAGPYLKKRNFQHVQEIERGETIDIGGVQVTATAAVHEGRQVPWMPTVNPLGYVLNGSHEIYFAGDTDLFPEMSDIGGQINLAFLPVWGWGPNLGPGHLDPIRAAEALAILEPAIAVPIHWGSYSPLGLGLLRPQFLSKPPIDFAEHASKVAPKVLVKILQPGQSLSIPSANDIHFT